MSVVICTYSLQRFRDLLDAIESIKRQTFEDIEILIIVDGNQELYDKIRSFFSKSDPPKVFLNKENMGLSFSRNLGIKHAVGDIIAFIDDDAIADKNWVKKLVSVYEERSDAIGVGGKILPLFMKYQPDYLPEELYWLIGATHKGFVDEETVTSTRNVFGSNMSFKREVFEKIGFFNITIGMKGNQQIQAEETEFSIRATMNLHGNIFYEPKAIVYHKVFPERIKIRLILKRAFLQGYSKAIIYSLYKSNVLSTESKYFKKMVLEFYPKLLIMFLNKPKKSLKQFFLVTSVITAVGLGYLYYYISRLRIFERKRKC